MGGHQIVIKKRGWAHQAWEPGEAGGMHKLVASVRDKSLDEWELVQARCACGREFDHEVDIWVHLDEVAVEAAADADNSGEEPKDASPHPDMGVGNPIGVPTYPIEADIFSQQDVGPEAAPRFSVTGHLTDRVEESWTVEDVLADLDERVRLPGELAYDTVFYTVKEAGGETNRFGRSKSIKVQLPPSAVLADAVPEGNVVRVTNAEHAPYGFVDPSE